MTSAAALHHNPAPDLVGVIRCKACGRYSLTEDEQCFFCKRPLEGPWAIVDISSTKHRIVDAAPGFAPACAEPGGRAVFEEGGKISAMDVLQAGPMDLLEQNRNWQVLICGPPGTGKTYTGIRIAEMLDPKFTADKIVFDTLDLIETLESCKAREFIIYDEAEAFSSRQSQRSENIVLSKIIAMMRFTQMNIIYCLPHMKMIDINARRVILNYLHTIPFNRRRCPLWMRNKSGVFWYDIRMPRIPMPGNDMEPSFVYPWVKGEQVSKVWFLKADPTILEEYERAKGRLWNKTLKSAKETIIRLRARDLESVSGGSGRGSRHGGQAPYGGPERRNEEMSARCIDSILGG